MPPGDETTSATASACPTAPVVTVAQHRDPGVFSGLEGQDVDEWIKLYEHASANNRGFIISVEIPDSPIVLSINVMDLGGRLANLTGARTSYRVIYYNNDSMILADRDPGVWGVRLRQVCVCFSVEE
ncbi:uncharacterized protein [Dermacentor andersoni]|uniref:uncharacterized protein isoform X2 n=1 Tax=Dermacentor andersoni TaxID=34620 RepID=UPI003B3A227C